MERLIRGTDLTGSEEFGGKTGFCDFFVIVQKGHEECGDSAALYCDEGKAVFAVFDGVSGESGAASASSAAAEAVIDRLKDEGKITQKKMEKAIAAASEKVKVGATTALILFLEKGGKFLVASIGDSPAYSIDKGGSVSLEIPMARAVKDSDSILKYFYYRNLVTSVIGGQTDMLVHFREGELGKGEVLILASDGLSDNLYVKINDGYVTDSSGTEDLKSIIANEKSPEKIVRSLLSEIARRVSIGKVELREAMLVPKQDDIAIVAVRRI